MSSFTALNLSAEDVAFDAEEHTRELQIEEAFKVFQRALKAQKAGLFEQSNKAYDELFEIEVITSELNISSASPTVKTLRYLAYRNRGLLHFDELRPKIADLNLEVSHDLLLDTLDDLSESLQYNEGDDIVINLLLSLFEFFGNDRLSRYLIEYQITKEETDELYLHSRSKLSLPNFVHYLQAERLLLKKLHAPKIYTKTLMQTTIQETSEDLTFLVPLRSYIDGKKELYERNHTKIIDLDQTTWKNIALKVQNLVPRSKQKALKYKDGYRFDSNTIQLVKFKTITEDSASDALEISDAKILNADSDDGHLINNDDISENETETECIIVENKSDIEPSEKVTPKDMGAQKSDVEDTVGSTERDEGSTENCAGAADSFSEIKDAMVTGQIVDKSHEEENDIADSGEVSLKRSSSDHQPQRSSKRVRHQSEPEIHSNKLPEFEAFLSNFKKYLSNDVITGVPATAISILSSGTEELCYADLKFCLENWTLRFTELLSSQNDKSQSGLALNELINTSIVNSSLSTNADVKELNNDLAMSFIAEVNAHGLHLIEIKFLLLKRILCLSNDGTPIIDNYVDKDLYKSIEGLVLNGEYDYFFEISRNIDIGSLSMGVATLEILVNHWINLKQKMKGKSISQKSNSDVLSQIVQIEESIERWRRVLIALVTPNTNSIVLMRFRWCCILYLQHGQIVSISYLKNLLRDLHSDFDMILRDTTIEFPNYDAIPTLNSKMIKNQSDKLNVLNTFERTLKEGENTNEEANRLLENVLLDLSENELNEEEKSMHQFISGSSIMLKLKLWKVLLDSYIVSSDLKKYERAMDLVLPLLLSQIEGEQYINQKETQRHQILLSTLGFYSDYTEGLVSILEDNNWCSSQPMTNISKSVFKFLRIFFFYIIQEFYDKPPSSNLFSETAPKSSNKINDIITNSLIILFIYESVDKPEKSEDKYDFFSVIHSQLGHLGFCDAASGRFLRLSENLWKDADLEIYESDILQHIDCRFHVSISNERFTPYEHDTEETPLSKESAIRFTPCLMNLIYRKKDNMSSILKPDLKSAIDIFSDAIGEPDLSIPIVQKNEFFLNRYLDAQLDASSFRKALSGVLDIDLKKGFSDNQCVADRGLFYSQAVNSLNVYKMRKKSMQSTVSELEDVHKMIKADLLYGSRRPESWFILGQAFSLQVEDDLVWTSDKLNVYDRKMSTAASQRKSILSYLMSLSLCAQNKIDGLEVRKEFLILVLSSLSQATFNSLTKPMSALCFKPQDDKRLLTQNGISSFSSNFWEESNNFLFKSNLQVIRLAVKSDATNWQNHYYKAKILHKLKSPVDRVLDSCLNSCLASKNSIEPHYLLLTMLYKYFKQTRISIEAAIKYLEMANPFFGLPKESLCNAKDCFEDLIITGLKKINHVDKKKWHHKHRYRLSRIYFDSNKFDLAHQEIESLIVLKSTNKNLVSIWKPEFEAPGKHFVYTYTYILYYVKLINHFADFHKLLLFTKKLRRYGSGMINLVEAWDFSCTTLCLLTKEIIGAEVGYTDIEVPKLLYIEFVQGSQSLTDKFKIETLNDKQKRIFTLLYEISEIRRMNNGFGSTSQLDDTFNAIYLKIYLEYVTPETKHIFINDKTLSAVKPSPTPIKSKVARRDILAAATALVKAVEPKLSENKINDERGFEVPEHIKHIHQQNATSNLNGTGRGNPDRDEKIEILSHDPNKETHLNNLRTPEPMDIDESLKSNGESEDEFHTPTNLTFDGDETEIAKSLQEKENVV